MKDSPLTRAQRAFEDLDALLDEGERITFGLLAANGSEGLGKRNAGPSGCGEPEHRALLMAARDELRVDAWELAPDRRERVRELADHIQRRLLQDDLLDRARAS